METQTNYPPPQDSNSGANTVLLVIIIIILVGFGFWWYYHRGHAAPANPPAINVDLNVPSTSSNSGGSENTTSGTPGQ